MPAHDVIHEPVKNALVKDGWTITDDPFFIRYEDAKAVADLAAERMVAAEKGREKIAVEIKSFLGPSYLHELEQALGQYELYRTFLRKVEPERDVVLAVSDVAYKRVFGRASARLILEEHGLRVVVVNVEQEAVTQWINNEPTTQP